MTPLPLRNFTERDTAGHSTQEGAARLIARLQAHWPTVQFSTEPFGASHGTAIHCIRSTLIAGLPPEEWRRRNGQG